MPDFPTSGGASAAAIWAYASRELTDKAGFSISGTLTTLDALENLSGADIGTALDTQGLTATRAGYMDLLNTNLDAAVSDVAAGAATEVWTATTRNLTEFTGQPRTDLLGENADFASATGARIADLDRIKNIPALEAITEASIVMDGTEKTLIEKTDTLQCYLDGYVDLTTMGAGDTIVIREYMKVKSGGDYIKYAEETYADAQTIPLLHIATKVSKRSIKVTAEQTVHGTYRTLDVQFAVRSQKTAT